MRCPYYTDGVHRPSAATPNPLAGAARACVCGEPEPLTLFSQTDPAPHRDRDPHPSHQAAERARPRARTQAQQILIKIAEAGATGASTRELQRALFDPADPAWNKVPTRCKHLQDLGLVRRWTETRRHDGQEFLVYELTAEGNRHLTEEADK